MLSNAIQAYVFLSRIESACTTLYVFRMKLSFRKGASNVPLEENGATWLIARKLMLSLDVFHLVTVASKTRFSFGLF